MELKDFVSSINIEEIGLDVTNDKDPKASSATTVSSAITWDKEDDCPQVRNVMKKMFLSNLKEVIIDNGYTHVLEGTLFVFDDFQLKETERMGFYGWVVCA